MAQPGLRLARRPFGGRNRGFEFRNRLAAWRASGEGSRFSCLGRRHQPSLKESPASVCETLPSEETALASADKISAWLRAARRLTITHTMQDEFSNRLDMFTRSLDVLVQPANKPVWENQAPLIFTDKVGEARTMVPGADKIGSSVTTDGDPRVTPIGRFLPAMNPAWPKDWPVWTCASSPRWQSCANDLSRLC